MIATYLPSSFLAGLLICLPGNTFAMQERVTLMLTGPACPESHRIIDRALNQTAGVQHVDIEAVPDHVLVDIETETVSAEALADQLNSILAAQPSCRAEVMKSCISADPRPPSTKAP